MYVRPVSYTHLSSDENDLLPNSITHKMWDTTDRADMICIIQEKEVFLKILNENIERLKIQHYVSKIQAQFSKKKQTCKKRNFEFSFS